MDLVEEVVPLAGDEIAVMRPRDGEALVDEHAFAADEFLPYWAQLWPSGVALARAVAHRALKGARVLEVGCGLGLPSIAAARAGGRPVASPGGTTGSAGEQPVIERVADELGARRAVQLLLDVRAMRLDGAHRQ